MREARQYNGKLLPIRDAHMAVRKAGIVGLRYQNGRVEVCVISSRKHPGRLVLPKGTIEAHEKPRQAAAREAFEEAGLKGEVSKTGRLRVSRDGRKAKKSRAHAAYYPMPVSKVADKWPERKIRARRWVSLSSLAQKKKYFYIWRIVRQMENGDKKGWNKLIQQMRQSKFRKSITGK